MNASPRTRLVAVLGSGGVGKTTSAASLAFAFAEQGLRSAVITVDPAHRLAQVLGLDSLSNDAKVVRDFPSGGRISALWLDTSTALEDLVRRHGQEIPNIEKVVQNKLFRIIQSQLGGIEEYLGVEKILDLRDSGQYDVCVLDTPPSRHAIDFLEAPRHLLKFFDEGVLKVFLGQSSGRDESFFARMINSGKNQVIDVFKSFLGQSFLAELSYLLKAAKPVHKVFTRTAQEIEAWTRSAECEFLLVSLLEPYPVDEARLLAIELDAKGLKAPTIVVLNKCLPEESVPEEFRGVFGDTGYGTLQNQWEMQQSLRTKIRTQKIFGEARICEIPRYSVNQLEQSQLIEMGKRIVSSWPSKSI